MNQKQIECTGLIALGCIAGLILLIIAGGTAALFLWGNGSGETLYFYQTDTVPEDAVIIKLTEEDYEKYPVLKDIPNIIYLDTSPLSEHSIIPGLVMRDTGWEIRETYGYQSGGRNRFIEHNGVIYRLEMHVS